MGTGKNSQNSSSEFYKRLWDYDHPRRILIHPRAERIPIPRWDDVVIIHWYLDLLLSRISPHGNILGHMLNTSLRLSSKVSCSDLKPVLQDCYWIRQSSSVLPDFCLASHPRVIRITQRWGEPGPMADGTGDSMQTSCLFHSWVSYAAQAHFSKPEKHMACNPP